jgi:iron complex transport system substrate-binding protein
VTAVLGGARRVLSLLPAATETIAALGAWERLVGVTHECDHPATARSLPCVTASRVEARGSPADVDAAVGAAAAQGTPLFTLDRDRIAALAPDLIVTQGLCDVCAVSEDDVRAVAGTLASKPSVLTISATRFDDVAASIAAIAAALDCADEGADLLAGMRVRLRQVHETLKRARAPRPRVAVIEWTDPLYVAGHWVPDMVRRAGGIDALGVPGAHSRRHSVEDVRAASPDVLLVAACGYDVTRSATEGARLLQGPGWEWARTLTVWAMDGSALTSRPGPRLCVGTEAMARIFHPTLFTPVDPDSARPLTPS